MTMLHETPSPPPGRKIAGWISAALMAVLLWPVTQNWAARPEDGFPLSYYPMFTKQRGATTVIHHAVAIDADGKQIDLPSYYAGGGGMNTTRRQMRKMVRQGRGDELAKRIAERLEQRGTADRIGAVRVDVVESTYDIQAFFAGSKAPVSRTTHGSAAIREGAPL